MLAKSKGCRFIRRAVLVLDLKLYHFTQFCGVGFELGFVGITEDHQVEFPLVDNVQSVYMRRTARDGKKILPIVLGLLLGLAIVSAGGYCLYAAHRQTLPSGTLSDTVTTKGWKSFTLKYEKLSFLYPPSWSIKDSTNDTTELDGLVIIGPNAFEINIEAGRPIAALATGRIPVLGADKLTFLGKDAYAVYAATPLADTTVNAAYLNASATATAPLYISKHVMPYAAARGLAGNIGISFGYAGEYAENGVDVRQSFSQAREDPNFAIAKTIIESMHY